MENIVMCIGNEDNGDDGIGPYIAKKLKDENLKDFLILDCGTVPENFTSPVKKNSPVNLIIVDATDMGLPPGEIRRIPREMIAKMHISTHNIPISVLISYLESHAKNIIIIGVQPKKMTGSMSEEIKRSCEKLIDLIKNRKFSEIEMLKIEKKK